MEVLMLKPTTRTLVFQRYVPLALLLFALLAFTPQSARGQTPADFTYQGKLTDLGSPANGIYDMEFKLYDTPDVGTGTQQGATVTDTTVEVTNGIFTIRLDFSAEEFDGAPRYLEIGIRPAGSANPYTVLGPRQPLSATPYSLRSMNATTADGLSVSCVNCITSSQIQSLDGAQVTGSIAGSQLVGSIPVESMPVGSGNYIQNSVAALRAGKLAVAQEGGFDITGDGTIGGNLLVNGGLGIGFSNPNVGQLLVLSSIPGSSAIFAESATGRAVWGKSVSSRGIYGESDSNAGVYGISNTGSGVYGESAAANLLTSPGVFGRATGIGGTGVYALSTGSGGVGVYGESVTGRGVWGKSIGSRGVYGESDSNAGVYGFANSGPGIFGTSTSSAGVVGIGGTGGSGVYGESATGRGVWGKSVGSRGVYGESESNTGVYGVSNTGTGVSGDSTSATGFGGFFQNSGGGTALWVLGKAKMNVLELTGGLDLAERFDIVGAAKPGMVVAIDPQNVGKFSIARGAYNRRVAGIISGAGNLAAGMVLTGSSVASIANESMPVALSGRVWVYCDATRNPITPGDLLTTSATPGHAMKVINHKRAQGAIIGKAMTALKSGRGLVLVLVTLQ
jgi:hypothetical protein